MTKHDKAWTGPSLTRYVMREIELKKGKVLNLIAASKAGHGDIIACLNGYYLELEIKGKGDTEKPHQAEKLNEAIEAGGYAAFIHNPSDLSNLLVLIDAGVPCPKVRSKIPKFNL